jgi:hypothetical protein
MDHINAAANGRKVIVFFMPASGTKPTGSYELTIDEALALAERITQAAEQAQNTPLSGAEAVALCTGTQPDQLDFGGFR